MNLPIPNGYRLYGGADISVAVDAQGSIFYSSSAWNPANLFGQIVVKVQNGVAKIVPLPEFVSGRGQLNYTPAGLYLIAWHQVDGSTSKSVPKLFRIDSFVPFNTVHPYHVAMPVPPARWVGTDDVDWEVTDEMVRDKLMYTDTLVNALREALIKNGLAK